MSQLLPRGRGAFAPHEYARFRRFALACAMLAALSCSRAASPDDVPQASSAPSPTAKALTTAQVAEGERLVGRMLDAMGGAAAIDGVRTLTLEGTMRRPLPGGTETEARLKTLVKFPNLYRQQLKLRTGMLTTLIGPSGAWILAGDQPPLPLPEERRLEIENIILRNPVALLKTRTSELFVAFADKPAGGSAPRTDELRILVGSKESLLTLDRQGLVESIRYDLPGARANVPNDLLVRYSNYRRVGTLTYPFSYTAEADGTVMYRVELESVRADELLPGTLFVPPDLWRSDQKQP